MRSFHGWLDRDINSSSLFFYFSAGVRMGPHGAAWGRERADVSALNPHR